MKKLNSIFALLLISINCLAQLPSWMPLSGLVAWYPFNGNANDGSGHGFNGTVNSASLTTDRFGNANASYLFNGVNGNIAIADNSLLRLNNTDYTISAWINSSAMATSNLNAILSKRTTTLASGYILGVYGNTLADSGKIVYQVSGGVNPKALSADSVHLNVWTNVIITYNKTAQDLNIYMNGILNSTTSGIPTPNATSTAALWIGNDVSGSPYCFNGKIDDIAIYNRILPACERNQLINASSINITAQPLSQNYAIGDTAMFIVASPDSCLSYQWQRNCGTGYFDLINSGVYSGVTNDTLIIAPLPLSFNNCNFRCVITSCVYCADTSSAAVLNVTAGVNENELDNTIGVFPNPAGDYIVVRMSDKNFKDLKIYSNTGSIVVNQKIVTSNNEFKIGIASLPPGIYSLQLKNDESTCSKRFIRK